MTELQQIEKDLEALRHEKLRIQCRPFGMSIDQDMDRVYRKIKVLEKRKDELLSGKCES